MADIVILGAGISGHTAALHLKRQLGRKHNVTVVTPNRLWNWIPSNVWVGVGAMTPEQVTFELAPIYKKMGINLHQARATAIHPEGSAAVARGFVDIEYTSEANAGTKAQIEYDYLINATGPRLNFGATQGLGPDGHSFSICSDGHAVHANNALQESIARMKKGERQTLVIGTGHGQATCQGAAFEYTFNVEHELNNQGVRDKADVIWISNESTLGDFGMGGLHLEQGGYVVHSRRYTESFFSERGVDWITQAHVNEVAPGKLQYETLSGETSELEFDFAMLLPPFSGVPMKAFNKSGQDITADIFAPNHMMKVDADYTKKPFEQWSASDWPETYRSPVYDNIFAVGIAFAPPHPISKPMTSPGGTPIFATPPRTGMPSGMMAKALADNLARLIKHGDESFKKRASMARMGAACVASAGQGILSGSAASITVFPIVPDYDRWPEYGRDLEFTFGEIGLAGHWIKRILHSMFIYKAKARPGWSLIPE